MSALPRSSCVFGCMAYSSIILTGVDPPRADLLSSGPNVAHGYFQHCACLTSELALVGHDSARRFVRREAYIRSSARRSQSNEKDTPCLHFSRSSDFGSCSGTATHSLYRRKCRSSVHTERKHETILLYGPYEFVFGQG